MPRKKEYNEDLVTEKAMNLFWRNGYEITSMQMLEKEMGINKFSIYSSFGSKEGLLEASIICYRRKLDSLFHKMINSNTGIEAIKQYFIDSLEFSKENKDFKGCFIGNTATELKNSDVPKIKNLLAANTTKLKNIFADKLREEKCFKEAEIEAKADYLLISKFGFSAATKVFSPKQLNNYLNQIFKKL
ncbi:TetR/AcrR family transcriptional regulator [Tenacibaculum piscium]|nr:TetR/AcrR family transcriptional regulator [Tenacibaculum piscium]MBE7630352.1 TetR family transcriptional regulator [Tenacibaculum piscium]MBE7670789.1 TetR family transcriptional regulator [Tenacibaculum piscium]MBE7685629.1 TetR family transcriptional regulator [Tenacibaculum piscium]MBE7690379.1 TetR family transcriptional regulator [Tenacibaculum piscium]